MVYQFVRKSSQPKRSRGMENATEEHGKNMEAPRGWQRFAGAEMLPGSGIRMKFS
jgi:hypothetical protein